MSELMHLRPNAEVILARALSPILFNSGAPEAGGTPASTMSKVLLWVLPSRLHQDERPKTSLNG